MCQSGGPLKEAPTEAEPARPSWIERGHNALLVVALLWLEYALIWGGKAASSFANLEFRDPDDAMRLVQVRDFLNGQSWFDVSQHRVNPPFGGPMHWSRLVDLPYAGIIALLRPLIGQAHAELVACIAVPLALTALICFLLYRAMGFSFGRVRGLVTVILFVSSFPILIQLAPLRIDHHGWQIAMAAVALLGALHPDPRRGGWIAGLATAMWLHISGEALPYTVIVGAALALRYASDPAEWPRVIRYLASLAAGSAALLLVTHGWQASLVNHCDSISPIYLGPLVLMPILAAAGHRIAGDATLVRRLAPLAVAGVISAALFLLTAGPCTKGPFETLDPLVYNFWYTGVMEGQPVWRQSLEMRLVILVPPLFGIAGTLAALWREQDPTRRRHWLTLSVLAIGAFAVSVMVLRAMSISHLFALAGNAWILCSIYPHIARLRSFVARVLLTVALCIISPAGLAVGAVKFAALFDKPSENDAPSVTCLQKAQLDRLGRLPVMTLFAPMDAGPNILLRTHHRVIGTAHHRNVVGMTKVLKAFLAPPGEARAIVSGTGADHLMVCERLSEEERYRKFEPNGLAAQLLDGKTPAWLKPVPVEGMTTIKLYRIDRTAG